MIQPLLDACSIYKKDYQVAVLALIQPGGGGHFIVKNTGGLLDGLGSAILVGKIYFGVLQKY